MLLWLACLVACGGGGDAGAGLELAAAPIVQAEPSPPSSGDAPAAFPAPAARLDITAFGAVCDGRSNDAAAIARAISAARTQRLPVYVPPGTCAYAEVIRLDGVRLLGSGDASVLHALDWRREAIFMSGEGVEVSGLRLTGVKAPERQAAWESTRITLFGARRFTIDRVTIEGSAAAGIQTAQAASDGRIANSTIRDTLADAIHLTDRASHITVENNRIANAGDDGIAVVSYRSDGGLVHHVTARNNVVSGNRWGRQMSVVGGSDVVYENNLLEDNRAGFACLYIAQEAGYATHSARNVTARQNTLRRCGSAATGHGAVMLYSDGEEANQHIELVRNDIVQNGPAGIRVFGERNEGVRLEGNRIQGASPAEEIRSANVLRVPYTGGPVGYSAP